MRSTTFVCETPIIIRDQSASLTLPLPPAKKFCMKSTDMPSSPSDRLFLPMLDDFENEAPGKTNLPFFPKLAPRPNFTVTIRKLSFDEEDEGQQISFTMKKRPASIALAPMPLQPCSSKQKHSLHAVCA